MALQKKPSLSNSVDNLIDLNASFVEKDCDNKENIGHNAINKEFIEFYGEMPPKNNPFDEVEEKAQFYDDPFEICSRNHHSTAVETSLSNENLISINFPKTVQDRSHSTSDIESKNNNNNKEIQPKRERCHSEKQNELLKLSLLNSQNTPFKNDLVNSPLSDSMSSEAKRLINRITKTVSSPGSSDSFEDLNSLNPQWVDSSFDQDLDDMRIKFKVEPTDGILDGSQIKTEPLDTYENTATSTPELNKNVEVKKEAVETDHEDHHQQTAQSSENSVKNILCNLEQVVSGSRNSKAAELLDNLKKILVHDENQKTNDCAMKEDNSSDGSHLTVPTPIVRQDTFDIDKSDRAVDEGLKTPEPTDHTDLVEQISKLLCTSNITVLQSNPEHVETTNTQNKPTYIVVVPNASPQVPSNLNQNQSMRTRRSFSLSLDKKPSIPSMKRDILNETPNKPKASSLTRRSSFSTPQTYGSVRKTLSAVENNKTPNKNPIPAVSSQNYGKRLSFAPSSLKPTEHAEKSFRPKHGVVKKGSPKRPGPIKAVPIPHINAQSIKFGGNANSRTSSIGTSRLMPKSPSLLHKNKRLSYIPSTPQNVKLNALPTATSRVRSLSAGKNQQKQLLKDLQ